MNLRPTEQEVGDDPVVLFRVLPLRPVPRVGDAFELRAGDVVGDDAPDVRAVARTLAAAGMDVALSYNRSRSEAEAVASDVVAAGRRSHVAQADLGNPAECQALVDGAAEAFGRLDVLVNMASLYERKDYAALTDEDWDRALAVDLRASHLCTQATVPHMKRQGGGRVVNFADWVAASGRPRVQ